MMWRIGLAFLLGHCALHVCSALPPLWPYSVVLGVCFIAALFTRSAALCALVLGFAWAWSHAHVRLGHDLPHELEGRDLIVSGRVASMLDVRDQDPQFDFLLDRSSELRVPSKLKLGWYDADLRPQPGEQWQFVVRLKRRNGFANPGGFDYEGFLFRSKIAATGYVREDPRNQKLAPAQGLLVLRARSWIGQRIHQSIGDSPMLGVLQGLAVGDTQAMSPDQWRVFGATGTSHLMAISGLHISMIAALAALLCARITRWGAAQRLRLTAIHGQALGGISAALSYSLLAGMSVPTQRTLVMLCVFFLVRCARRELSIGNALGLSLLSVLIIDPFAPLAVGAWLSFGAVAIILLATLGRIGLETTVGNFVRVQWAVTLGLLPVIVFAFGSQSIVSPVANALAVPLFTLALVPIVLIGAFVATFWLQGAAVVLGFAATLLGWCWPLLEWLADQPWSMWHFPQLPIAHAAMLAVATLMLILPGRWPLRVLSLVAMVPVFMYRPAAPASGNFELNVLDVGQGLSVVIRTREHVLVYDAGPAFRTGRDTGELVIVPYLRARGIRAVDTLVVSHGDLDHAGGAKSIVHAIGTRHVLVGPSVSNVDLASRTCAAGQEWSWDGVQFRVLHPGEDDAGSDNNTSCVLRIEGKHASALLTGDIEADAEATLLSRGLEPTDVVVVAHHGSRSSSTEEFVAAARAKLAIVSAGYRNRWGFPKKQVTERWREAGAEVISTIESGALELSMTEAINVRHYRLEHRKYWSAR